MDQAEIMKRKSQKSQSTNKRLKSSQDDDVVNEPPVTSSKETTSQQILAELSGNARPSSQASPEASRLEALPPELRRHLLSTLNLEELQTLIHASPVYYQQYVYDREWIFASCLDNMFHGIAAEVCAVYKTSTKEWFDDERNNDKVLDVVNDLIEQRKKGDFSISKQGFEMDDLIDLALFHTETVKPLVWEYALWALQNLGEEPEASIIGAYETLRDTEEARITRAIYRYQLLCNLLGIRPDKRRPGMADGVHFEDHEILDILHRLWEPWECEEVFCIQTFGEVQYRRLIRQVENEINFNEIQGDEGNLAWPLYEEDEFEDCVVSTLSRGLEHLHTAAFEIESHSRLVRKMQRTIRNDLTHSFLGYWAHWEEAHWQRRIHAPSAKDTREEKREPFKFQGDRIIDPDGAYPPLAWTIQWEDTYSNVYGSIIHGVSSNVGLSHWGWVMWDADRVERSRARAVIERMKGPEYRKRDPRECVGEVPDSDSDSDSDLDLDVDFALGFAFALALASASDSESE